MKLLVVIITIISGFAARSSHEFYVSITEMNLKNDTLQVSVKVFTHDLEEVIKDETGSAVFFDSSSDQEKALKSIKDYATKHLTVGGAGKQYELTWIGHEYEADVTWIYAYAILDKQSSLLFVRNTLLTSHRRNQHNMIHVTSNGNTRSKICTAHEPEARFMLK